MSTPLLQDSELQNIFTLAAQAVDAIGTEQFSGLLAEICGNISAYDNLMAYTFIKDEVPQLLFNDLSEYDTAMSWERYSEGAYLLDPFYKLFRNSAENGLYHLIDIAPDNFSECEYFKRYYKATKLRDEATIVFNCSEDAQIHLSLGLRYETESLAEDDIYRLKLLTPLLISLCKRHWPDIKAISTQGSDRMGAHMETAFQLFGSSCLSERECETAHLVLMGHSSKSIARLLDISPETVKVYRKNIFTKLDISSQGELFFMFINCLKKMPLGADSDPLTFATT